MKKPLLSIITVSKDNVSELYITLSSILESLPLSSIEIIVVSGSTDSNYNHEIKLFPKISQIKIFRSEPLGVYSAMNYGLTLYNGSWIWFLNSGDLCSIADQNKFVSILLNERDANADALLFYGSVRSTFSIYPSVKRPLLQCIIDKHKWFRLFPAMHPCILVSSSRLSAAKFRYSTLKPINADQEYISFFQHLPKTRSYSYFISEFTLGGISTKGPISSILNIFSLRASRHILLLDEGLVLLKIIISDLIRSLLCIK